MNNPHADALFDFVSAVHESEVIGELNRRFGDLVRQWGFENWVCVQISARPGAIVYPLARHFGEVKQEWMDRYREARHIHRDAAAREVVQSVSAFWWSDFTSRGEIGPDALRVFSEAREFGMGEGLAVPVRFPDGSVWSCLLTGSRPEKNHHVTEAASIAAHFYAGRGGHLRSLDTRDRVVLSFRLTPRQRQIVEALRFGKTQQEIAQLFGLSASTVHNELAEARRRLGVATAAELVAEALLNGEIALDQEH